MRTKNWSLWKWMRKVLCREPWNKFESILCNRLTDERKGKTNVNNINLKVKARKLCWMEYSMRISGLFTSQVKEYLCQKNFFLFVSEKGLQTDKQKTHAILRNKIFCFFLLKNMTNKQPEQCTVRQYPTEFILQLQDNGILSGELCVKSKYILIFYVLW